MMAKSLLPLIMMLALSVNASAYDFKVDGLCYDMHYDNTVMVTYELERSSDNYRSLKGDIVIPNQVTYKGKSFAVTEIGYYAFKGCTSLTSVTIPNSVTEIGVSAFKGCTSLTSITIPNSVKMIDYATFRGCKNLTSITIPNSVTYISWEAFEGCSGLVSINVEPTNPTFDSRENCNAVIETATNSLTVGCKNTRIPSTVKRIETKAFFGCTSLTSITIPNSVTEIGRSAFEGCTSLTSITIPNSVTKIGSSAFKGCSGLTSVTIPDSVKQIGQYAFSRCTGLTSITIPNSVTKIEDWAFEGCTGLTSITIPNSVTEIGSSAFKWCTSLTSVIIPNSVTKVDDWAFVGCKNLTSITIPNSVTYISWEAFEGCSGLVSINVEPTNPTFDSRENCNAVIETATNSLTVGCKNTRIPSTVKRIETKAFFGCTSLTSITIPNSVTEIGRSAFYGCTGLTSITIPNSVTMIGFNAFEGCSGLVSINVEPTNPTFDSRENCNAVIETATNSLTVGCKNTRIPSTVKEIGSVAFYGCMGLTSVTIPNSVTKIEYRAFGGCKNLTSITIPNSVTEIEDRAFEGCTSLTSITIPNSVTEIGRSAFYGCMGLTSVTIPNSVTKIEYRAFGGCKNLTSITIPNSVTEIEDRAFEGCTGLTSITIPNSVTKIEDSAFEGCTGMTSVTIPDSVTHIGDYAFKGCTGLTSITIPNSVTKIEDSAFEGCTGLTSITIPNSVTKIDDWAFEGCTGLTSVTIPDSVTHIGDYAFNGCTGLTSITIPNSVTKIEDSAFEGCTGMTSVTIPDSVTHIGDYAFNGCTGLTSITIPNSVTKIGSSAFEGCSGLTSVTIPNSVTMIGERAFADCTGLTSVTIPNSVTKIGRYAFENCINMESIVCLNKNPQNITTDIAAFKEVKRQTCILKVPSGTIASYSSVSPWCYFVNKIDDFSVTVNDTEAAEHDSLLLKQKFQRYFNKSQYDKAIQIGETLLATDKGNILLIEQLAICNYMEENYSKAREYYEIIDTTFANSNESDSYETALRNEKMGDCYVETDDFVSAEKHYLKAYQNYLSCDSPNVQIQVATMLFNIHSCFIAQGKLLDAVNPYLEFQSILKGIDSDLMRKAPLFNRFLPTDNLNCILKWGDDLCNQNRYDEALKMYSDGTVLYQKTYGEKNFQVAVMNERIGRCLLMMKQYNQVLYYLNLSKEINEKDDYHIDYKVSKDLNLDYGIYYASQGDFNSSYTYLRNSLHDIYNNSIRFLGNNTSEERLAYWEKNSPLFCEIYPYVVTMAANERFSRHNNMNLNYSDMYGDLYNKSALFAKGLLMTFDKVFSRSIIESGDSILISRYKELEALKNVPDPLSDEQSAEIKEKATELEQELIVVSKDYREFTDNLKLKWTDVQKRLRPDDIAIEFLSFPKLGSDSTFYVALTLRKDYDSPRLVRICEEHELQAAAKNAYTNNELSKLIWGKLSSELKGVKNIYFSPSGALHQLAIESMPHWKNTKTLMNQHYNIYRLSSTRELVIDRDSIQPRTAAVYGDINYNTEVKFLPASHMETNPTSVSENRGFDADSAGYRGKIWNPLKFTKGEIDSIVDILKNKEIMVDSMTVDAATETSFKGLNGQKKSIIHIATHGFCWSDSTAMKYNMKKQLSFMTGENYEDKVMTRTGLLFSGANNCFSDSVKIPDDKDDGVLTAKEVSSLDLRGLDLLVLSACETGQGEVIGGEGVFGLQRGFKKAGAQTIIMSLWSVNDKATSEMMTQFYHYHFTEGMTKREAFQKAQQDIKNKYDKEHTKPTDKPHWAAFILLDALDNK